MDQEFNKSGFVPLSTAEAAVKYLENKIIHNEFKPGQRLIERELSKLLGVSKIPIREALQTLEKSGLVRIVPRKGATVTPFTPKEIEGNYAIRETLVGLAARLAARHICKEDLAKIKKIAGEMARKCEKNNLNSYFSLNLEFSQLLSNIGRNQQLNQILSNLGKQTYRLRFTSMSLPGRMQKSCNYHQQLVKALEKKDEVEAERIAQTIIREAGEALMKYISKK